MLRVLRSRHRSKRCINQPGKKLGKWFFAFACEPVNKNRRFIGVVHGRSNNQRNLWARSTAAASMLHFENCAPQNGRFFSLSPSLSFAVTREEFSPRYEFTRFFFISFQFRVTRPRE